MPWLNVIIGLILLTLGRRLFWFFVGASGFILGFHYAYLYMNFQPTSTIILIALCIAILGTILAIFLQGLTISIIGFLCGAYLCLMVTSIWIDPSFHFFLLVGFLGGIVGVFFLWKAFDVALILFSSFVGASTILSLKLFDMNLNIIVFICLFGLGVWVQTKQLAQHKQYR